MPELFHKGKQRMEYIPDRLMARAIASGEYETDGAKASVVDETIGETVEASADDILDVEKNYDAREESLSEELGREDQARKEREHGGILGKAATLVESGINSATLGAYDYVGGKIGGDDFRTRRKESEEVNSGYALAGEIAGYVMPGAGLGKAGKLMPVSAAERLGSRIAATGAGGGLVRSTVAKGAGMGVEGAIVGAGETLSEYGLATTELERERAMSSLSSNMLFGAAVGGGIGAGANVAAKGIRKAKKLADEMSEKLASRANISDDVASLDKAGIRAERATEQARLGAELRDSAEKYQRLFAEADPILIASGESEKVLISERNKIRKALGNKKGFAERPGSIKDALQRQEQALESIAKNREKILADLAAEDLALAAKLPKKTGMVKGKVAKKYGEFANKKITKGMAKEGVKLSPDEVIRFRTALEDGSMQGARKQALDGVDRVLEANRRQLAQTDGLLKGTAPRLEELKAAEDALASGGAKRGFGESAVQDATFGAAAGALSAVMPFPVASLIASKVSGSISDLVLGRLGKAATKTAKKTSDTVSVLMDAGAKTLEKAPPMASRVLQSVRYAEKTPKLAPTLPKATLIRDFKAREAEIYSQVTSGPRGITMRPEARKALADRLSGVRAASPELADSMETIANRKISYLASKLPKKPDFLAYKPGPDDWHPGNEAIRTFARFAAAVEDPAGVEERLADGTITPQDVEAYKAVYPERYTALRNDIASRLPELQSTLPIAKRMALSIFTDLPVEPSMHLPIFMRLQSQYEQEPGTEGGTMAPKAMPNFSAFGSQRSDDKTRSQKRAD